ncbi:MAG: GHKL domain-containing protein [Flavisolibacter sp.]|nr:GHKL domain-containing protein [Flavisolibacter sp.]
MRKLLLFWNLILLLLLNAYFGFSQEIVFRKVIPPTGNFTMLSSIAQDQNGYMWLTTHTGLYKYDGYRFQSYTSDPSNKNSLSTNELEKVYADREGFLWILTYVNGVDRFDPLNGQFTHFQHNPSDPGSLSCDTTRSILQDHEGVIWIGTNNGLDRYNPKTGKFQHFKHNPADPHSLSCNQVRKVYEDREGTLWIGTGSIWLGEGGETDAGGLNRFDRKTESFTSYLHDPANPHSLINNKVQAIFEDSRGTFWVGTAGDGLHTMDRSKGTFERHLYDPKHPEKLSRTPLINGPFPDHISFITEDAVGNNIWIGTVKNGISRYDPKKQKTVHFTNKDSAIGFTANSAWSCYNSKDGILWISTFDAQLFRIDPYHKNIPYIDVGASVWSFQEDSENNLFIGTDKGLMIQSKTTGPIQKFTSGSSDFYRLTGNVIYSLYKDQEGTIWMGTDKGLNCYNPFSHTMILYHNNPTDPNSISVSPIITIKESDHNTLYLGTMHDGLYMMNKRMGTFTHFRNNSRDTSSISRNNTTSILIDRSANVWVGTSIGGGLNLLDPASGKFRHFLKTKSVNALLQDSNGTLWIGTNDGLFHSSNLLQGFSKFTDPGSGIDQMSIRSIQEDDQKNLWVSTSQGIYLIHLQDQQLTLFDASYGVKSNLNVISGYKGSHGDVYFGDQGGYYVISPGKLMANPNPPQIALRGLRINGQEVMSGKNSLLLMPKEVSRRLSLNHSQNIFSLEVLALHFSNPENNRVLYQLQGYDPVWHDAGSDKMATFYNVPPGHYTLKIRAASSEGVWTEKAVDVIIHPPWWRTWWAYCIYGLCLLAAIYWFDRFQRGRLIAKERERTREREIAQTREIEKAYKELKQAQAQLIQSEKMASLGELTAGIAHEIQNPLNFVKNFSEVSLELLDEAKENIVSDKKTDAINSIEYAKENLRKIMHHGRRADSIVKSMVEHSRISRGERQATDINTLADEYLHLAYHGFRAKEKNFTTVLETDFDRNIEKIEVVPQDIGRVLLNLFNNAFYAVQQKKKHAGESYGPVVSVSTRKQSGKVEIMVKDNGNGIPQKVVDKIFQPFFTTKSTGEGTGLGLSLSYDIIKAHGGEISVKSAEGQYAEFIILLPLQD